MKKLFLASIALMPVFLNAQSLDSTRVEQYCEMTVSSIFLDNKMKIEVNYGEAPKFFKYYGTTDDSGFLEKFSSVVDGLNYLGLNG